MLRRKAKPSGDLLERARDDEIGVIHREQIGRELAREVILVVKLFNINIGIRILSFLQRMSNRALCHSELMS